MSAAKKHNTLVLDCDMEGLPADWRDHVESTVRHVGKLFDLYVTSVRAGATANPPRILVSISREGADEAWTEQCRSTLSARILQQLDAAREEEAVRRAELARMESAVAAGPRRSSVQRFAAVEVERDAGARDAVQRRRTALSQEVRARLAAATLPIPARDLANLALDRMKLPDRWALWARVLLAVEETSAALGDELEGRVRAAL